MKEVCFKSGESVEVNFEEEYIHDVWFPATVEKDIGNGSFLVEYQSSTESGYVKVVVDSLHIRSPPPSSSCKEFKLLDKVDAFYGFGWSSGVVTKVLADGRYIVFFKRPRKEKELSITDLRLHMHWVDGEWVTSSQDISLKSNSQKQLGGLGFDCKSGMVSDPSEGSIVQREIIREEMLPVISLRRDQREKKTHHAEKSPSNNTSSRMRIKISNASLHGHPTVKSNREAMLDTPLCPEASIEKTMEPGGQSSEQAMNSLTQAAGLVGTASVEQFDGGNQPSAKLIASGKMEIEKKNTKSSEDQYAEGPRKRKRSSKFLLQIQDKTAGKAVAKGEDSEVAAKPIILALASSSLTKIPQVERICQLDKLETGNAMNDEKTFLESVHSREVMVNTGQINSYSRFPKRKRGRPANLWNGASIQSRAAGADAYQINQNNVASNGAEVPMVNNVPLATDDLLPSESPHQKPVKLIGEATPTHRLSAAHRKNKQSLKGICGKRGRRKRKILSGAFMTVLDKPTPAQILTTNLTDQDPEDLTYGSVAGAVQYAVISESDDDKPLSTWFEGTQSPPKLDDAAGDPSSRCEEVTENENQIPSQTVDESEEEAAASEPLEVGADNVTENGNPLEMRADNVTENGNPLEMGADNVTENGNPLEMGADNITENGNPLEMGADNITENGNPLEMGADNITENGNPLEMGADNITENGNPLEMGADNITENGNPLEMVDELARQSTAIVPIVEHVTVEDQNLPFLKNSLVWEMVESMDVFRFLPQRPHFLPLYDCKEDTREGLAIGNMVTFASLVEKVTKFQFDDPRSVLDSSLETLVELERHGFSVKEVRSRIEELISIKSRQEEAVNTRIQLENQMVDLTLEKSGAEEEIAEIEKKIAELQERRSLVAVMKEGKSSEINTLRTRIDAVNVSMDISRAEFGRIAKGPW